jgi:Phage integrase family
VQIGAAPWLHVPVGKLHDDRYLPLHPNLVARNDDDRARFVPPDHPLLLPRPNGTALDRHAVTRMINRAGAAAGLPHIHPHQLRHALATQAINRGMSLEAIAAMLGHRSMDMTLRYAKIANRTVADEYFAVTDKVEALDGKPPQLPADAIGPEDGQATPRPPPLPRKRPLHPTGRAGLRVRVHLRKLHVLPDQHRVPAHPASPTRPRRQPRSTAAGRPVPATTQRPQREPSIMIHLTQITHIRPMTGRCVRRRCCVAAGGAGRHSAQ